ncbi:hypothetical protein ANAPRD1_00815 [Anaplasma phagocytophilum]|nr:hypothetical protein ANAPH1_00260 [Anaplasma phagocytophilum]SCV65309.1 hypothetical protein ANAPRD1_00815 [Anaplasma phagocytophilum]SCV65706.1 hypothetical protein ANAPH2_01352 [Anaplasma phagocytophilum]
MVQGLTLEFMVIFRDVGRVCPDFSFVTQCIRGVSKDFCAFHSGC